MKRFFPFEEKRKHVCEQCKQEVPLCSTWFEFLFFPLLSFVTGVVGVFLTVYYAHLFRARFGKSLIDKFKSEPRDRYFYVTHISINIVLYVLVNGMSVLTFRIFCFCFYKSMVGVHILLSVAVCGFTYFSHTSAISGQRIEKWRPPDGILFGVRPHSGLGYCTYLGLLSQMILGPLLLYRRTKKLRQIKRASGISVWVMTLFTVVSGFQQEQDRHPANKYVQKPLAKDYIFTMAAAISCTVSMTVIACFIMRREANANTAMVVPAGIL